MDLDQTPRSPLQSPAGGVYVPKKVPTSTKVALGIGAVAALISGFVLWNDRAQTDFGNSGRIVFSANSFPLFPSAVLTPGDATLTPLTVPGQGTASLYGYVHEDSKEYVILSDGDHTNVFALDTKNSKQGLSQVTHSETMKLELTHSLQTNAFAFTEYETPESTGKIAIVQSGTTTERIVADGHAPVFLKGGAVLVYESGNALYAVRADGGSSNKLLDIPKDGTYAVDGDGLAIVMYTPGKSTYSVYSVAGLTGASYQKSLPATQTPEARLIAYADGTLTEAIVGRDALVLKVGGGKQIGVPSGLSVSNGTMTYDKN